MRLSTAEIKKLLKECTSNDGYYTLEGFYNYVKENTTKEFTRNQITGAVRQLWDSGDLCKVERGLYTGSRANSEREQSTDNLKQESSFVQSIITCLGNVDREFDRTVCNVKAWDLDEKEFKIFSEIREYKYMLDKMRERYINMRL